MDILIITTGLENAIRNVKDLAPELTWHGQKNDAAVASVGNCRIGLWARTENTTQMEIEVFRPLKVGEGFKMQRDSAARVSCDALIARLRRVGLCQFYPDRARIADETLRVIHFNEKNNQAELLKLAGKTAEQAAAEYFARFENADKPTAKQATKKKNRTKWDDTEAKIQRLKEYRTDWMQKHSGKPPKWTVACNEAGIDPKTARTHAKELREHWEDKEY